MPETEHTPGPIDSLIADRRLVRKRLLANPLKTIEDINNYICNEDIPTEIAILEQVAEQDDVIQEVVEQLGSYIQPDLARQIFDTIMLGGELLEETRKLLLGLDDLARKRVVDLCNSFEKSMELTVMGVTEATVEDEDEDEDDDDDEGEDKPKEESPEPVVEEENSDESPAAS